MRFHKTDKFALYEGKKHLSHRTDYIFFCVYLHTNRYITYGKKNISK